MKRKKLDEEFERLIVTAEGTPTQAKEIFKEDQKKQEERKAKELEYLSSIQKRYSLYNSRLATLLLKKLREIDWDKGWEYSVAPTEKGVVMELRSPYQKVYACAFQSSGDVFLDLNAVEVYCTRAQNTIDHHARLQ